jgi:digeranylgeranylglycerophospholipid reductase
VGASCAGLIAARDVAAAGMRTLVLDSRPSLAEPERRWIVTQKIGRILDCDFSPSIVHQTGVMELIVNGSRRSVSLERPDLVIERAILRRILAREAEAAGAEFEFRRRVAGLTPGGHGFNLRVGTNGQVTFVSGRNVVGADGTKSVVAKSMGADPQVSVPVVQARVRLPSDYDPDVTKVWFDRSTTRFFYWLIPESRETGVLGLIAEGQGSARGLLDGFLARKGLRPEGYQGAMIPLHRPWRRIEWRSGNGRAILVGDAAGHVKVTTVGGVVSGIWGARAAARAIVGDTSYRREARSLHRELYFHDLLRLLIDRFHDHHYAQLLALLNVKCHVLLARNDRDSCSTKMLAFLRAQPQFLPLFASAFARPWLPRVLR